MAWTIHKKDMSTAMTRGKRHGTKDGNITVTLLLALALILFLLATQEPMTSRALWRESAAAVVTAITAMAITWNWAKRFKVGQKPWKPR
jgi:protein-S-isoprenylcysteine O-methyltransferase Ste14